MIISLSVSKMQTCEAHSEERWCAVRWATLESTKMPNADIWGVAKGRSCGTPEPTGTGFPSGREPASGRKNSGVCHRG